MCARIRQGRSEKRVRGGASLQKMVVTDVCVVVQKERLAVAAVPARDAFPFRFKGKKKRIRQAETVLSQGQLKLELELELCFTSFKI